MKYEEILQKLDVVFSWVEELGLGECLKESRFTKYHAHISRLCSIISASDSFESLPDRIKEELETKQLEYVLSLTESMEFTDATDYLKIGEEKIRRHKVEKILQGPFMPLDENQNSNEARNTLFEINLASQLHSAGLKPTLSMSPDVQLEIAGKQVLIECKRPLGERAIVTRIKRAREQIDGWTKKMPPGSRGVIAVSATKVLNAGDKLLPFYTEAAAKENLSRMLSMLAAKADRTLSNLGKKIIGVIFHAIAVSLDQRNHRYALGQQCNFHHLAKPESPDHAAFQELGERLSTLEH